MDQNVSYMTAKLGKNYSRSPSRAEPDVQYAEVNFKTPSAPRVRADRDGLNSTYSDLNFRRKEPCIDESECPRIAQGPGRLSTITQTAESDVSYAEVNFKALSAPRVRTDRAAQERESKVKIGNRPYRLICLLCLVTAALIVIVVGLSIHVSQIRQSTFTSDRNCHELNSTVEFKASLLNSNLSDLKRMNSDLHHQFTELETKYRSVNEAKAQFCELLTSRRAQAFSQNWIRNDGPCYFISTVNTSYDEAKQNCSKFDSKLLEINSTEEENFVVKAIRDGGISHWIGKCKDGKVASNVMFRLSGGDPECAVCTWYSESKPCDEVRTRFICEKSAHSCPVISEKIQDLCHQPLGPT
ncbi:killer cell lectin-like receptor 7 [Hemitrygon akajei]|uniref:killer cell lectin-like receptor 7 n=1 Tax=Hemitrygon akajei TaxID=2704970 RepID=UPI003BFA0D7B